MLPYMQALEYAHHRQLLADPTPEKVYETVLELSENAKEAEVAMATHMLDEFDREHHLQ